MRLFLDQQTHLPLMLTYKGMLPRFFQRRGRRRQGAAAADAGGDAPSA